MIIEHRFNRAVIGCVEAAKAKMFKEERH